MKAYLEEYNAVGKITKKRKIDFWWCSNEHPPYFVFNIKEHGDDEGGTQLRVRLEDLITEFLKRKLV
jgi:hypothetical protein